MSISVSKGALFFVAMVAGAVPIFRRILRPRVPRKTLPVRNSQGFDGLKSEEVKARLRRDEVRLQLEKGLAVVGAISVGLLIWQNFLIQRQLSEQAAQRAVHIEQLDHQVRDDLAIRRAQLVNTIYTVRCKEVGPDEPIKINGQVVSFEPDCKPSANPRTLREAVVAFAEIERSRGALVDLRYASLQSLRLDGVNLSKVDLTESDLGHVRLTGGNLEGSVLDQVDFRAAWLDDVTFRNASASYAYFRRAFAEGADFESADLSDALMGDANLSNANFRNADLTGVWLENAHLDKADFAHADLDHADLRGAWIAGSRFAKARNITIEQLAEACGDSTTALPEDVEEAPASWDEGLCKQRKERINVLIEKWQRR